MAQKIIERVDAHYEAREVPFGKSYEWQRSYQHEQDEAAYPEGSPWRYDAITGDPSF
jgi:hypothetical protein